MFIRIDKNGFVDAVVQTGGIQPSCPPNDTVIEIQYNINPPKTIQVTQNVQTTDENGNLLFDENGQPIWETETIENPDGTTTETIVTQTVNETYYLMDNPTIFTKSDIDAVCTYDIVGSLSHAQTLKKVDLHNSYVASLNSPFTSSADNTSRQYGYSDTDQKNMNKLAETIDMGIATFPVPYGDVDGNLVMLDQAGFKQLVTDANTHNWNTINQYRQLVGNVMTATTIDEVNAITWS